MKIKLGINKKQNQKYYEKKRFYDKKPFFFSVLIIKK